MDAGCLQKGEAAGHADPGTVCRAAVGIDGHGFHSSFYASARDSVTPQSKDRIHWIAPKYNGKSESAVSRALTFG